MSLGTYVKVWEANGVVFLAEHEEPRIDAAVTRFLETARDSLLSLDRLDGTVYKIRASLIESWLLSSPESRQVAWELEKVGKDEDTEMKQNAGIWDDAPE